MTPAVLHLSPHPDDELVGAPATLMALRDAGWQVVNLACGLGRPEQRPRREEELREACRRAGFELRLASSQGLLGDGGAAAPDRSLIDEIVAGIEDLGPALVVSPSPADRHPAHEALAAAARQALRRIGERAPRWWTWGLWGALPRPTLATAFDDGRLEEILGALSAHRGELERNDYRRLVRGRGEANACLAPELLFGFGAEDRRRAEYAELLTELALVEGEWRLGQPRWLDPLEPLPEPSGLDAGRSANAAVADEGGGDHPVVGEVEGAAGE